ncbi:MAG: hypothetical protein DELT_01162 [Desulfovibrio sp.]
MKTKEQVMESIVKQAKETWPDDKEMQNYMIKNELDAYREFEKIDFSDISPENKETILSDSDSYYDDWEDRVDFIRSEIDAIIKIEKISTKSSDELLLEQWKNEAATSEYSFCSQLDFIERKIKQSENIKKTRKEIDPIKHILIAMEDIVGNSCYNDNIQNYGSWGELESTGRSFRYPVSFSNETSKYKRRTVPKEIPAEDLMTGYYAFGANQLNIYSALYDILKYLEKECGLIISPPKQ